VAGGVIALAASRLLLGFGEGGGFPAATRAVAEWFPVQERSTAMGIINAGTAIGAVIAPPLIALILTQVHWFGFAPWRWVFFLTGALGLLWTIWWWRSYFTPANSDPASDPNSEAPISLVQLLRHRETWAIIGAKFLSDGAWYFYLFWLPKYLFDAFQLDIKTAGAIGWIPYAASGVGCLCGGALSSWLLARGISVNGSRKIALGASAALMPWVMLVPQLHSLGWVIFIFSLAFFGQQSWSTLVMILPTDLISKKAVGTLAGLVGFGGAMGGLLLGQIVGWLRDNGYSYTPALMISGSLHVAAFLLICLLVPKIQPLKISPKQTA
jgi:MFS transporter, ACS family, hexuronate transporter